MTVCTPVGDVFGVCDVTISLPHLLGGAGILASFPLSLNPEEKAKLQASAEVVCAVIASLDQELTE
jgi:L-lactate dehydrogenase